MTFALLNTSFYGLIFVALIAFTKFDAFDGLIVLACMAASQLCYSLWEE